MQKKLGIAALGLALMSTSACNAEETALALTPNGLGALGGGTAYSVEAIATALPSLTVASEEYMAEGDSYPMIVARDGEAKVLEIYPRYNMPEMVGAFVILTDSIVFEGRAKVGDIFNHLPKQGSEPTDCVAGMEENSGKVLCHDGEFPHVGYVFSGDWAGPDGELPPAHVLDTYKMERLTWSAGVL